MKLVAASTFFHPMRLFRWKKLRDNSIKCPSNYQPKTFLFHGHVVQNTLFRLSKNDQNELNDRKFINDSSSLWLIFFPTLWQLKVDGKFIVGLRQWKTNSQINIQFSYHILIVCLVLDFMNHRNERDIKF